MITTSRNSTTVISGAKPALRISRSFAWLVLALLAALATWGYVSWINTPFLNDRANLQRYLPRATTPTFTRAGMALRELLLHGRDPYSQQVTQEIQLGFYGHALDPNNPADPIDQQAFAYPLYTVFLLAPLVGASFAAVQSWFGLFLLALAALSVPLWLVALRMRLDWPRVVAVTLLGATSFGVVQGAAWLQPSLIIGFIVAASMALLAKERYFLAGLVMALATIKPQLIAILLVGLLVWSVLNWRERKNFVWGLLASMALLLLGAEMLLPNWIGEFLAATKAYQQYTGFAPLLSFAVGFAWVPLALALGAITIWLWVKAGQERGQGLLFNQALALAVTLTLLVVPMVMWYNQILLVPALLLLLDQAGRVFSAASRLTRILFVSAILIVGWQWLTALLLSAWYALAALTGITSASTVLLLWWAPVLLMYLIPFALAIVLLALLQPLISTAIARLRWKTGQSAL